jgi:NADPH:quinone reductase-like Zn-dependent oxidoreductase
MLGLRKPKDPIPGTGFAGVVVAVGEGVTGYQVGDAVFGETTLGFSTNAEYVVVPEDGVVLPKPAGLDFAEAASFGDGPVTSLNFLRRVGQLKAGQQVLIIGASGSLGTAAVQLAKYFGAQVTGVCSTRNMALVRSLGADRVIDYTKADFTRLPERYDLIYDTVGVSSFAKAKGSLQPQGMYLSPVLSFPLLLDMLRTSWSAKGKRAKFTATGLNSDADLRDLLTELVAIYEEGKLRIIIDRQFSLEKLAAAHSYIDQGHKVGNVVIRMSV